MKKDSFVKGATIATICMFIAKFLGIIYVIPFYSIIGEQGGALYGYAYSIYSIFLSISTAGIPTAVSKVVSEYDALGNEEAKHSVYKVAIKVLGIISIVAFLVLMIFAPQIGKLIIGEATGGNSISDISLAIRAISLAVLVVPFLSVLRGYLQGEKFITPTSVSEIIEQVLRIAILLLGSYVLIKNALRFPLGQQIMDLGCGYGPVGIIIKRFLPDAEVTMIDVNSRAVELAAKNCILNHTENTVCLCEDILSLKNTFNSIILNPPIRAGKSLIYGLYEKSFKKLADGGSLFIVIQKKHGAESSYKKLKELFKEVSLVDRAGGYQVYRAVK